MTDETPQPEGQPSPAAPEETPTAETKPLTPADASARAGDEDDVAPAPPPVTPAAAPAATTDRPAGIFVPKWVALVAAAIVAALVFGGIGYAIGDSSSDSSPQSASNTLPNGNGGQTLPGGGQFPGYGGNLPNGGQFPGGGQFPNGNGNGNRDGNGNGPAATNAGYLGVAVQTSTDPKGVEITEVGDGSPAAEAGLKDGDVITAIDGNEVTEANAVRSAVQAKQSGDEISVTYTRDGSSNTVKVTLASRSRAQSS
jgi:membrane-associated protease RseP (regulator of RpoE activity)